jgi:hypothetical protein
MKSDALGACFTQNRISGRRSHIGHSWVNVEATVGKPVWAEASATWMSP